MIKIISLLSLSLLISFCTVRENDTSISTGNNFEIKTVSKAVFDKVFSQYDPPFNISERTSNDSLIKLYISDSLIVFRDTLTKTDSYSQKNYEYLGELNSINKYVVQCSYWEYSECLLIDKSNGKIDTVWNTPIISSDLKYLASKSLPYGLEGLQNGLQIFKVKGSQISKLVEIDQQEWIPEKIAWSEENELFFSFMSVDDFWEMEDGQPLKYAKLVLK
ncbi:hypothetical protein [Ekhidna sp. To15]|uniref:hypothetical protein n=1 Tax=Ekhidna sp. To15 TaxID=3395267 RepID=UPI003F5269C7